jgi:hypothetical protein
MYEMADVVFAARLGYTISKNSHGVADHHARVDRD